MGTLVVGSVKAGVEGTFTRSGETETAEVMSDGRHGDGVFRQWACETTVWQRGHMQSADSEV